MRPAFDRNLKRVSLRCNLNLLLRQSALALTVAGAAAMLAVTVERLLGARLVGTWVAVGWAGAVAVATALLWLFTRPTRMGVAMLLDERLALRERFSTALAIADSKDPFAAAARQDAHQVADRLQIKGQFPVRLSPRWLLAAGLWLASIAIFTYVPNMDLLGYSAERDERERKEKLLEQAKSEVKEAVEVVKATVRELSDEKLALDLAALTDPKAGAKPADVRREAIRRLSDLSEKIKQMQGSKRLEAVKAMEQMLKRLRSTRDGLSAQLDRSLAKADFQRAAELLREIQKKLADGKLSDKDRQALEKQLKDLSRQLDQLARVEKRLGDCLEKEGLDKKLAGLDEDKLREELKKQGLSKKKIDELMEKLSALRSACANCGKLAKLMAESGIGEAGEAGELTPEELERLIDALGELGELKWRIGVADASLEEIERAIALLGEGDCEGNGDEGLFLEGLALGRSRGTGGPGRGSGPRKTADPEDTAARKTGVKNKPKKGPIIASWYFKGQQIKGEAKREFSNVVKAAKDRAADAVSDKEIPRKYEAAVKKYFSDLEQKGDR